MSDLISSSELLTAFNNKNVQTKIVIDEMIQNNREQMTHWKNDCGMYKLLECQNNALLNALESIS